MLIRVETKMTLLKEDRKKRTVYKLNVSLNVQKLNVNVFSRKVLGNNYSEG